MSTPDLTMTDTTAMLRAAIEDMEQAAQDAEREIETIARIIKTERPIGARLAELAQRHVEAVEDRTTYTAGLTMLRDMLDEELAATNKLGNQ